MIINDKNQADFNILATQFADW